MHAAHGNWWGHLRRGYGRMLLLIALCTAGAGVLPAQGTAFVYQGRLHDGGIAANGAFDLRVQVFDAVSGGTAISGVQTLNDVIVQGGLFSATIALGGGIFTGADRYLQVSVRPGASSGSFTVLSPRQRLLPTPYAIFSGNANLLDGIDSTALAPKLHTHGFNELTTPPLVITADYPPGAVVDVTNSSTATTSYAVRGVHGATAGATAAVRGETNSTVANAVAIEGRVNPSAPGSFSAAVRGTNNGTTTLGVGVVGSHAGSGFGVYGATQGGGIGVYGLTQSGVGVQGQSASNAGVVGTSTSGIGVRAESSTSFGLTASSTSETAARFSIANPTNANPGLEIFYGGLDSALYTMQSNPLNADPAILLQQAGVGHGMRIELSHAASSGDAVSVTHAGTGDGVSANVANINSRALHGVNTAGTAIYGENESGPGVPAIHGQNSSSGIGVLGSNTLDGVGVIGQSGALGGTGVAARFENLNAANGSDVVQVNGNGAGIALDVTATGASGTGIRVATAANQGRAGLTISNGTLVLSPQSTYTSGGVIDNGIIRIGLAGDYTLPTAGVPNGTTVWLINDSAGVVNITNLEGGVPLSISQARFRQFMYYSTVSSANWIAAQ